MPARYCLLMLSAAQHSSRIAPITVIPRLAGDDQAILNQALTLVSRLRNMSRTMAKY